MSLSSSPATAILSASSSVELCKVKDTRHLLYYDKVSSSLIYHYIRSAHHTQQLRIAAPSRYLQDFDFVPIVHTQDDQSEILSLFFTLNYYDDRSNSYVVATGNLTTKLASSDETSTIENWIVPFPILYRSSSTPRYIFAKNDGQRVFLVQSNGHCLSICPHTSVVSDSWQLDHSNGLLHAAYLHEKLWVMDVHRIIYILCPITGHRQGALDMRKAVSVTQLPTCWHPSTIAQQYTQVVIGYENGTISRSIFHANKNSHVQTSLIHTPFGLIKRIYADNHRYIVVNEKGDVYTGSIHNESQWYRVPVQLDMNHFHRFYANKRFLLLDGHPNGAVVYDLSKMGPLNSKESDETHTILSYLLSFDEKRRDGWANPSLHDLPQMTSYLEFLKQTPIVHSYKHDAKGFNPLIRKAIINGGHNDAHEDLPSDVNPIFGLEDDS
jgi:hypothetical protein